RQQQQADLQTRAKELAAAQRLCCRDVLNAECRIASLALQGEARGRDVRRLQSHRDALRVQRRELSRVEEQHHQQRRKLLDRRHALEFEIQKQQHQLQTLNERIQEEYQLSLEELVDSGTSAY